MGIPRNIRDDDDDDSAVAVLDSPPLVESQPVEHSAKPTSEHAASPVATPVDCPIWATEPPTGSWWKDPGKIALSYDELMRQPTARPVICDCGSLWFWESITGGMSCVHCERILSFTVLKDFWKAIPFDEPLAGGQWLSLGWERWFPSICRIDQLFNHLLEARRLVMEAETKSSRF